jgi:uncharacterized protein YebE (UPF0316 family)
VVSVISVLTAVPLWELAIIFFAKVAEVSLGTLRQILINKGFRREGTFLSFFEISLWVFVASRVILGIADAPIKGVMYSIGFAAGVYIGSCLEERLAFGCVLVQMITSEDSGRNIAGLLRAKGYGVTTSHAEGKDSHKMVLMIFANRKGMKKMVKYIQEIDKGVLIVTNEVSSLYGGYFPKWKHVAK